MPVNIVGYGPSTNSQSKLCNKHVNINLYFSQYYTIHRSVNSCIIMHIVECMLIHKIVSVTKSYWLIIIHNYTNTATSLSTTTGLTTTDSSIVVSLTIIPLSTTASGSTVPTALAAIGRILLLLIVIIIIVVTTILAIEKQKSEYVAVYYYCYHYYWPRPRLA